MNTVSLERNPESALTVRPTPASRTTRGVMSKDAPVAVGNVLVAVAKAMIVPSPLDRILARRSGGQGPGYHAERSLCCGIGKAVVREAEGR